MKTSISFALAILTSFGAVACASSSAHDDAAPATDTQADELAASFTTCKTDADCVAIPAGGCCPNGLDVAVNQSHVKAYEKSHECHEKKVCPLYVIQETRTAECNTAKHKCEMVHPEDIRCGGFTTNPHQCPTGWACDYAGHVPDVPGNCVKKTCVQTQMCMKDAHWDAASCSCVASCVDTKLCTKDAHWDAASCSCVANCVDTKLCTKDAHWDSASCSCVANCVQTQMCMKDAHWDSALCHCVAN